jgi:hypothetical protein
LENIKKNMIDGVLKKYGKYAVKRPIDKQTIRLHGLAHHTYDREWQPHSAVGLD